MPVMAGALLDKMSDEKILDVFETNVFGAMRVTRAVLPHMRNMGGWHVSM